MKILDSLKKAMTSSVFGRFVLNPAGNVAIPFALTITPILGIIGASIDYSRTVDAQTRLQLAADAAALLATKNKSLPLPQREQLAEDIFWANLSGEETGNDIVFNIVEIEGGHRVTATTHVETTLIGILGFDSVSTGVTSESAIGTGEIEVALVLDNTGSMANEIDDLRDAATDFTNIVFEGAEADTVHVAVVPYVTSVNVGSGFNQAHLDINGDSAHHGAFFENKRIARFKKCSDPIPEETPTLPTGYTIVDHNDCGWLKTPAKVNHFDLFDEFNNVTWKGCVEARPEPYDVLDTPPDGDNPDTLFVPYFWADESDDYNGDVPHYNNDFLSDSPILHNNVYGFKWRKFKGNQKRRSWSTLKYDNVNQTFDENPPSTNGPNKACPQELLPLTSNQNDVLTAISTMSHNYNGGTVTPQGLVWGWRVLSPGAPFTEGQPYGTDNLRKVIVLMTDGYNQLVENDDLISDYSGYGYALNGRFPEQSIQGGKDYIDGRLQTACENIKAEGIFIYTVLFDVDNQTTREMYEDCASSPEMAMTADNVSQLHEAFVNIGEQISELRLSR